MAVAVVKWGGRYSGAGINDSHGGVASDGSYEGVGSDAYGWWVGDVVVGCSNNRCDVVDGDDASEADGKISRFGAVNDRDDVGVSVGSGVILVVEFRVKMTTSLVIVKEFLICQWQ